MKTHSQRPARLQHRNVLDKVGQWVKPEPEHPTINDVAKTRRRGAAAIMAALIATGGISAYGVVAYPRYEATISSDIPVSENPLNTSKNELTFVPASGAFGLVQETDPTHDTNHGVYNLSKQLGHSPEPGDIVAVPITPGITSISPTNIASPPK